MSAPSDFRFHHRLRVRWVEVDAQQVVFNGHYLTYLDVAISEYWRHVGLPYPDAFEQVGGDIFVRRNTLEYHAPARLDDALDIGVRCERIGTSSITMCWAAWCNGRLLVTGEVVYVHVDAARGQSAPVPEALRRQLNAHEQGLPVNELTCGSWQDLAEAAGFVRRRVFVSGERASDGPDHARIGRMAVLRSSRGIGLGQRVLRALIAQARQRGVRHLSLHAQVAAMPLYAREGFVAEGPVFDEVGIPHQRMVATL